MKFAISAWRAVSPFHRTLADWQQWVAEGEVIKNLSAGDIDVSFLPAMKRRRLSSAARLMFAASWPLLPEYTACPVVFVSHDGEINRSFQLWQSLIKQEELSPTSFALSVHNAIVGQWSMLRADMSECTALSAQYNGLELGVAEAVGLLQEGAQQVLVVVVDEPMASEYEVNAVRAPFPMALGLVVTHGDEVNLEYRAEHPVLTDAGKLKYYSSTLEWIVQRINAQSERWQSAPQGVWYWRIN